MPKRVMLATGGTGGHIYPAVALAQELIAAWGEVEILFVGGGLAHNRYFDRDAFPWKSVSSAPFNSKNPLVLGSAVCKNMLGIGQSCAIIRQFKPDIAIGFGSFYSFPPLVASKLMKVPFLLHEANSLPGKVNRLLAPWAAATGVHFPMTAGLVRGRAVEVGLPLRKGFCKEAISVKEARREYGLQENTPTLLVFGGSQGARVVNDAVAEALSLWTKSSKIQVLHLTGDEASTAKLKHFYADRKIAATVKPFEKRMELAWSAADGVVCRAGAGAVAEMLEFEVPGILIPFAAAADDHQSFNADFISDVVGGGVKIIEKNLSSGEMQKSLEELFDERMLAKRKKAMNDYKLKRGSSGMVTLIQEVMRRG